MSKVDPLKSKMLCANGGPMKCRVTCDSCRKISGHTSRIKIPKVNPDKLITVFVYRTGMIETKNALMVRCQKQTIEGINIPAGYEIWLPGQGTPCVYNSFSSRPFVHVPGWKVNEILRTFYIDNLRNG